MRFAVEALVSAQGRGVDRLTGRLAGGRGRLGRHFGGYGLGVGLVVLTDELHGGGVVLRPEDAVKLPLVAQRRDLHRLAVAVRFAVEALVSAQGRGVNRLTCSLAGRGRDHAAAYLGRNGPGPAVPIGEDGRGGIAPRALFPCKRAEGPDRVGCLDQQLLAVEELVVLHAAGGLPFSPDVVQIPLRPAVVLAAVGDAAGRQLADKVEAIVILLMEVAVPIHLIPVAELLRVGGEVGDGDGRSALVAGGGRAVHGIGTRDQPQALVVCGIIDVDDANGRRIGSDLALGQRLLAGLMEDIDDLLPVRDPQALSRIPVQMGDRRAALDPEVLLAAEHVVAAGADADGGAGARQLDRAGIAPGAVSGNVVAGFEGPAGVRHILMLDVVDAGTVDAVNAEERVCDIAGDRAVKPLRHVGDVARHGLGRLRRPAQEIVIRIVGIVDHRRIGADLHRLLVVDDGAVFILLISDCRHVAGVGDKAGDDDVRAGIDDRIRQLCGEIGGLERLYAELVRPVDVPAVEDIVIVRHRVKAVDRAGIDGAASVHIDLDRLARSGGVPLLAARSGFQGLIAQGAAGLGKDRPVHLLRFLPDRVKAQVLRWHGQRIGQRIVGHAVVFRAPADERVLRAIGPVLVELHAAAEADLVQAHRFTGRVRLAPKAAGIGILAVIGERVFRRGGFLRGGCGGGFLFRLRGSRSLRLRGGLRLLDRFGLRGGLRLLDGFRLRSGLRLLDGFGLRGGLRLFGGFGLRGRLHLLGGSGLGDLLCRRSLRKFRRFGRFCRFGRVVRKGRGGHQAHQHADKQKHGKKAVEGFAQHHVVSSYCVLRMGGYRHQTGRASCRSARAHARVGIDLLFYLFAEIKSRKSTGNGLYTELQQEAENALRDQFVSGEALPAEHNGDVWSRPGSRQCDCFDGKRRRSGGSELS